jgi:hypothetical protein
MASRRATAVSQARAVWRRGWHRISCSQANWQASSTFASPGQAAAGEVGCHRRLQVPTRLGLGSGYRSGGRRGGEVGDRDPDVVEHGSEATGAGMVELDTFRAASAFLCAADTYVFNSANTLAVRCW